MFTLAKPIWPRGLADEMNIHAVFTVTADVRPNMKLYITAATFYRVWADDRFLHFGPARTARGHARVDILPIEGRNGKVSLTVEVLGCRCNSLSAVNQTSFIQAELRTDDEVIAFTGRDFHAYLPGTRVQRVQRFSLQRHFCESWDFRRGKLPLSDATEADIDILSLDLTYLPRRAAYPAYRAVSDASLTAVGTLHRDPDTDAAWAKDTGISLSADWGWFPNDTLARTPFIDFLSLTQVPGGEMRTLPLRLRAGEYAIFDYREICAGFFRLLLEAESESEIILAFSEDGSPEHFHFPNLSMRAVIEWMLSPGKYDLHSFEPYSARYVMLAVTSGELQLHALSMTEFAYPIPDFPRTGDEILDRIARAAYRSFAHNTIDIYMDCPARERAGWLCDSYFTAQTEYALTGRADVERDFLENFLVRPKTPDSPERPLPDGMLPRCFPSYVGRSFMPQWALWYVLELEQFLNLRAPDVDRERYRTLIADLMAWFARHENSIGLLENLPGGNFIDYSKANEWTVGLNYPTNLLYAEALECCDRIWGSGETEKANAIRRTVTSLSFDGKFFRDHAYRDENGNLVNYPHVSEACQYYAFRFGAADRNDPRFAELVNVLLDVFGPDRTTELPDVAKANALTGIYVRMELLMRWGEYERLAQNIRGYFGEMAKMTGTLWEFMEGKGSRDHGFTSYAAVAIAACRKGK